MKHQPGFLTYLHSFRGFAILNIVYIHAMVAAIIGSNGGSFAPNSPIAIVNEVLFHDSTLYFSIISGLLFAAVLQQRGYTRFYTSKLKYVVLPYLIITAIVAIFKSFPPEDSSQNFFVLYFPTLLKDFVYGKANPLFWYIPVLIFLYGVTPLLGFLMKHKSWGRTIFFVIIFLPLVVSRVQMAFEYILSVQTMIYFTGSYALGMYIGESLDRRISWIANYAKPIWGLAILSTIALFYLYFSDLDMLGPVSLRESLFYVQKTCLSAVFILTFYKRGQQQPQWLQPLARDSFGIYFIHGFAVFGSISLFMFILGFDAIAPFNTIIGSVLLTVFSIGVSMLVIWGVRKIFKKNSRMFIGS